MKFYKVFIKDLKNIKVRSKKTLPPVPAFFSEGSFKDIET